MITINNLTNNLITTEPLSLLVTGAENKDILITIQKASKLITLIPVLIGDKNKIISLINRHDIQFENYEIVDITNTSKMIKFASEYYQNNRKTILMKGMVTTAEMMKEIIRKDNKLRDSELISHAAIFESQAYHKPFCITDVAMNIDPDLNDKKIIIENAVKIMQKIGIKIPKVACISAIEYVNKSIISSVEAAELKKMNQNGEIKNCIVDGPFGLDNAISKDAAQLKGIVNEVAGDADILLVPDLICGNVLYKSLIYFGNAQCAAIITGTKVPIVLTSRADTIENKFNSIMLANYICSV